MWLRFDLGPLLQGKTRIVKLKSANNSLVGPRGWQCVFFIMSTHIIFAFSAVRRPTWFPDILGNSSYPIFTKFGMQVYWFNILYGIAFGDDSSIAN